MTKDSACIFCQVAGGQIPASKVWENKLVIAFHDMAPSAETHILIIPKTHVGSFTDLDDLSVWEALRQAARQIIADLNLVRSYKLVFNGGSYQHIPHLHWHLLGGKMTTHP